MTRTFIAKVLYVAAAAGAMTTSFSHPPLFAQMPSYTEMPGQPDGAERTVGSSQIIGSQGEDEWLASQLRGTAVIGADNVKVGEVVDVLLDRSGKARAFIVGEGGVMGLGAREIAIDFSQFHQEPASGGGKAQLKVPMTKDQLANVPEFKSLPSPEATTGSAPGQ
jgi:sporulation protein YlmC with PRC-barrel domain